MERAGAHIDWMRGVDIHRWMLLCGVIPVGVMGVAGNALATWTWNALRRNNNNNNNNNMTPFFMYLGVSDALQLLTSLIKVCTSLFVTGQHTPEIDTALLFMGTLFDALSVSTTITIGVLRWLGVARPQRMRKITRRHVVMACAGLFCWGSVVAATYTVGDAVIVYGSAQWLAWLAVGIIAGHILPTLLLLGFSVALLVAFRRHQGPQQADRNQRRVTLAVLAIAGSSILITCPATLMSFNVWVLEFHGHVPVSLCKTWTCGLILRGVSQLLMVLNATINFLIYVLLVPSFREELGQKFRRILHALTSCRPFSTDDTDQDLLLGVVRRENTQASPAQELPVEAV